MDTLPTPHFSECLEIASTLSVHEWKPCIALIRYGVIPRPVDKTLLGKIPDSLFSKLFDSSVPDDITLTAFGRTFFGVSTKPVISSMLISMILAQIPPPEYIDTSIQQSFSKEFRVMESVPRESTVKWRNIFNSFAAYHKLSDECDPNPAIHKIILHGLNTLKRSLDLTLLWPYCTRRGISEESSRWYIGSTLERKKPWIRENVPSETISSTDIVANFLNHGDWTPGDCEMKQKWYPHGLIPRTYFAQGGEAIRVSCYLRDFFNEVCDSFLPTNRYARVDASRLITYKDGYFFIYDLTSFTSNFHEQREFLNALADFFLEVPVFTVGFRLRLSLRLLGEMIAEYTDVVNTNPRYRLSTKLFEQPGGAQLRLTHHVAGFLGVPGNLASCTFPHGVLVAQHTTSPDEQSCAGDDGCVACRDHEHQARFERTISSLGIFQTEKGSSTFAGEAASYLKRRFLQNNTRGFLVERVEFVLLSVVHAFTKPDPRFPALSSDRSKLRNGIAASVASLFRSLYQYTHGTYLNGESALILEFLHYVYRRAELPKGGEIRGMIIDDSELRQYVRGTIVFPLEERFLLNDPDLLFSEMFTPWIVVVPEMTDIEASDFYGDWCIGDVRSCRLNPILEKLVKYGWLERKQTSKKVLVGPDARLFFRRLLRDEIDSLEYEYVAKQEITSQTLEEIGVYDPCVEGVYRPRKRRRFYHKSIFDPDDPVILSLRERPPDRAEEENGLLSFALDTAILDY